MLVPIQGNLLADAHTVAVFRSVNAELGGGLVITEPDGADRSDARQRVLIALHALDPIRYAYAAPVGKSNHKGGHALDIKNWARYPRLQPVMRAHGMIRDAREQWHYNDSGAWIVPAAVSIPVPIPAKPLTGGNTVSLIIIHNPDPNGADYVGNDSAIVRVVDPQHTNILVKYESARQRGEASVNMPFSEIVVLDKYLDALRTGSPEIS